MRAQLEHLLEVADLPNLTLQVLPLDVGEHAAMSGAFTVYRFAERADPDVVYLEHTTSDLYVENHQEVERYGAAFERLKAAALSPHRSAEFVNALVSNA
jgi:hypothetical protein